MIWPTCRITCVVYRKIRYKIVWGVLRLSIVFTIKRPRALASLAPLARSLNREDSDTYTLTITKNFLTTKEVRSICFERFVTTRQGRHWHSIFAVLTSVSLMTKWLKPGRLFCPYFHSDSWSTESLSRNVTIWCDGTVSRRPRIHHRDHWRAWSFFNGLLINFQRWKMTLSVI